MFLLSGSQLKQKKIKIKECLDAHVRIRMPCSGKLGQHAFLGAGMIPWGHITLTLLHSTLHDIAVTCDTLLRGAIFRPDHSPAARSQGCIT